MVNQKKVLFIHNTLPEYRIQFFCELGKLVDLTLLITDQKLASSIYQLDANIPKSLNVKYINSRKEIRKSIVEAHWDIVVLPPADTVYQVKCAYVALKACKKQAIKTAYWTEKWEAALNLQPLIKKLKNRLQGILITYFAKNADLCIAAGSMSKRYFLNHGIEAAKIKIAIDSSTSPQVKTDINIRSLYQVPANSSIVLFFSRVVKRKGADLLVKAMANLNNPNAYLLICGDGEHLQEVEDIVKQEKVKNVIFCGKIQPSERAAYFAQSDVFVLPSYSLGGVIEAWGLTCNEALEQGTPVIATTAVGAAHDMADGHCFLMVNENDIDSLKTGIEAVLAKGDLKMNCKALYSKFSIVNMAESFYDAFKME